MGGRNHQPCSTYLLNSTRLSKHISLGFAHLEFGNATLEDILLDELSVAGATMNQASYHHRKMLSELERSDQELEQARVALGDLRVQMENEGFVDLPSLGRIDLESIGREMVGRGLVSSTAWQKIHTTMKASGFKEVAALFDLKLEELLRLNKILIEKLTLLDRVVANHGLSSIVEENQNGNFKIQFAALYSLWAEFHQLFLASSMISTELWYAFTNKGSLLGVQAQVYKAA